MYLLDTNIISELMKADIDPNVEAWFHTVTLEEVRISDISLAELYRDVAKLPEGKRKRLIADNLSKIVSRYQIQVLAFNTACAKQYGSVAARNEQKGLPMDAFDGMLLAVAETYELTIVTRNEKHCKKRTKNTIINPFTPKVT